MFCAQVNPEAVDPSSQAGSHVWNVDHSVSQTGLVHPASGDAGASVYPWLVNSGVQKLAAGSASMAAAYCCA